MGRCALALVALTLVLGTSACEDDPEPQIADPTTEATSEPTSEPPTSEPPTEPVALGPVETVRAWIEGQNEALVEASFKTVDALSLPSCQVCNEFLDPMRRVYEAGGRFETKPWRIVRIKANANGGGPRVITVAVVIPGGVTYPSSSADPVRYETERSIGVFTVAPGPTGELGVSTFEFLS